MIAISRLFAAGVGTLALLGAGSAPALANDGGSLIQFDSMMGVTADQTKVANDRGINGGGLPWVISEGTGEVGRDGSIEVRVRGLVIPSLGNINPVKTFGVTVSCLTHGGVVNVTTGQFPASRSGDSDIEAQVQLPMDCQSPEVFMVSPNGAWFAKANSGDQEGDR